MAKFVLLLYVIVFGVIVGMVRDTNTNVPMMLGTLFFTGFLALQNIVNRLHTNCLYKKEKRMP